MAGGGGGSSFGSGLWVVDSEKVYQGEYWTNRYIIAAADLGAAGILANQIVQIERAIHWDLILFTRSRVSDGVPLSDVYAINNVNLYGSLTAGTNVLLPLFNALRVDFNTAGGGRPSRKYLRGCLGESHITFNAIETSFVTFVNSNYATPMAALAGFVDVDGQEITSGSAYPQVAMRQLRRGSKRKAPPPSPATPV